MINTLKDNKYWEPARKGFVTNYPNFQHWKKTTATDVVAGGPLNVYVHIPFCAQQCAYCYYRTVQGGRKSEIDTYVDALCAEIKLGAQQFHLKDRPVLSVYFGGGTPTLLSKENLFKINDTLREHLNIGEMEFTVEAEPVTLIQKKADALKEMGVNRISLGVQSLSNEIIKLSNRQDTEEKVVRAINIAQSTGAQVNIDLLSGLAGETMESWQYSVNRALEIGMESVTVYKMELYANTDYFKELRKESITLPDDAQELEFMQYALDQFKAANYLPWSFFTFTKDGDYPHVHAPRIWGGDDCFAVGASAFAHMGDWVYQNTNDVNKYAEIVNSGELPIHRGHWLTSLDHIIRETVLGMKLVTLDLNRFRERHGFRLEALCGDTIAQLTSDGFVTCSEESLALTDKGMLYGDYVGKSLVSKLIEMY